MRYSKEHVWVRDEDGFVRIGLSDFAQEELGELTFVEFPQLQTRFAASEVLCSIDSLKAASDIYSPVSGTVISVNERLLVAGGANLANLDPLGDGWLLTMQLDNPAELANLLSEEDYYAYTRE